jgi:VWFA-related protein
VHGDAESPAAPEAHEPQPADAAAPAAGAGPVPDDQRLNLALFLDHVSLLPAGRNQLLPTLEQLLARLRTNDRVGIVVYDGTLKPLLEPTADLAAMREALARAAKMATRGHEARLDQARVLRSIDEAPLPGEFGSPFAPDSSAEEARAAHDGIALYAQQRLSEARRVTEALRQTVASLAGARGRKALVYVGEGFSQRPSEALLQAWESKFGRFAQQFGVATSQLQAFSYDAEPLAKAVAEEANGNLVTLYAVGTAAGSTSAEEGLADASGSSRTGGRLWAPEMAAVESFNRSAPLRLLAGETGGRAAVDGPNPAALFDWLDQDLRAYYSLGYAPPHAADGKPHKIEVRVRDRELRLRHRTRYVAKTSDQRMRDRTLSALLFGADDNPLDVAVDFGAEAPDERGRVKVEMTVRFPMANVFLVPGERHHEGRLSIFIGSRGEDGGVSDIQKVVVPVRVPNDRLLTALGQSAAYRATLVMRRGPHQVAAGVRDELGNVEAAVRVLHTPGAAARPTG